MEDRPSLIRPLAALAGLAIVLGATGAWELALIGAAVAISVLVLAVRMTRRRTRFLTSNRFGYPYSDGTGSLLASARGRCEAAAAVRLLPKRGT